MNDSIMYNLIKDRLDKITEIVNQSDNNYNEYFRAIMHELVYLLGEYDRLCERGCENERD